jgi:hypothetical protein
VTRIVTRNVMKKPFFMLVVSVVMIATLTPGLPAQNQAVITETTGKVEILPPGGSWLAARVGMALPRGATISTGFNSTATLDLGTSILQVKPLTRMELQELLEQGGAVSTELFLKVGKVRAEVKTGQGLMQDFKLKSPVTTAAVRGTTFEFEDLLVEVINGEVFFTNLYNQSRSIAGGEVSSTDGFSLPTSGQEGQNAGSTVDPTVSPTGSDLLKTPATQTAKVTVRWVWQ